MIFRFVLGSNDFLHWWQIFIFRKLMSKKLDVINYLYPYFIYPFYKISMYGSVFITLAISMERYLCVCHPTKFSKRTVWHYLIPIVFSTIGLNIPNFTNYNLEFKNDTTIKYKPTDQRKDPTFIGVYISFIPFLVAAICIAMLSFFTIQIIRKLMETTRSLKRYT